MRTIAALILYAVLAVPITIGLAVSCTPLAPLKAPTNLTEAQATAQGLINEANVLLTACANVIASGVKEGTMPKDQAQKHLDKVREFSAKVDEAQALLRSGNEAAAMDRAQLVRSLILELHRALAAQARKS